MDFRIFWRTSRFLRYCSSTILILIVVRVMWPHSEQQVDFSVTWRHHEHIINRLLVHFAYSAAYRPEFFQSPICIFVLPLRLVWAWSPGSGASVADQLRVSSLTHDSLVDLIHTARCVSEASDFGPSPEISDGTNKCLLSDSYYTKFGEVLLFFSTQMRWFLSPDLP